MIGAALLSLLSQPVAAPAIPTAPDNLAAYGEIVYSLNWTSCCARFRGGVPDRVIHRVEAVERALSARHGVEAMRRENAAVRSRFDEAFGIYDPAPQSENAATRRAARRESMRWYDAELDRLEARLGLARR